MGTSSNSSSALRFRFAAAVSSSEYSSSFTFCFAVCFALLSSLAFFGAGPVCEEDDAQERYKKELTYTRTGEVSLFRLAGAVDFPTRSLSSESEMSSSADFCIWVVSGASSSS
jgi:hypothetical protein